MIPAEDLRASLFVAVRFARQDPRDADWAHVAAPAIYRVLSLALPYVALECLASGRKFPVDASVFEFEQMRPEFVASIFPDQMIRAPRAAARQEPQEDRDEQGYRKPVRLATIKAYRE